MYYPEKIKQAPITGLAGFGGGASGLGTAGSAAKLWYGDRAVLGYGIVNWGTLAEMDYYDITSTGNASDFGDGTQGRRNSEACSDAVRGVWMGGHNGSARQNTMDYVTIASAGNATDFGDLIAINEGGGAASDGTLGVNVGGEQSGYVDYIQYITIQTTGNATDEANLTQARAYMATASNGVRMVNYAGHNGSNLNTIDYITIASKSDATDFGDAAYTGFGSRGCFGKDNDRMVSGGIQEGSSPYYTNWMEYVTMSSTGNGTDFGDLTVARYYLASAGNGTRGTWASGAGSAGVGGSNVIDYVTLSSTGNATDFGDLVKAKYSLDGTSGGA